MTKPPGECWKRPHGLSHGPKLGPIVCPKCGKIIKPGREFKVVDGVRYHKACRA